jgi:hypothetical protein
VLGSNGRVQSVSISSSLFLFCLLLCLSAPQLFAGRYGGDFLRVEPGAASVARGGTGLLLAKPGFSAWWNPALLSGRASRQAAFQHAERFEGLLSQDHLALTMPFHDLDASIYLMRQAIDDIPITNQLEGGETFEDGGLPWVREQATASDLVLGVAAARPIGSKWNLGVAAKFIRRDLVEIAAGGISLDVGVEYLLSENLRLGAVLKDASGGVLVWDDGETEWLPPEWALGSAWTKQLASYPIRIAMAVELRGDTQGEVADASGNFRFADARFGFESMFFETLILRGGWFDALPSAGAGLHLGRLQADYAWRPHDDLGVSHLLSVSTTF